MAFVCPGHDRCLERGVEGLMASDKNCQQHRRAGSERRCHQLAQHAVVPVPCVGHEVPGMSLMMHACAAFRLNDGIFVHMQCRSNHGWQEHRHEHPCCYLSFHVVSHSGGKDTKFLSDKRKIASSFFNEESSHSSFFILHSSSHCPVECLYSRTLFR